MADAARSGDSASATDSTSPTVSASDTASASSTASASATAPATTRAGAFTGKKDASVPAKLTQISSLTMKKVVFPKTLGGMPMLGSVDEGTDNRYAGYSKLDSPDALTATASINTDTSDVEDYANRFKNVSSYDGGRIKCGYNSTTTSMSCVVHIAGSQQITVSTTSKFTNDQMAKFTAELLNAQK